MTLGSEKTLLGSLAPGSPYSVTSRLPPPISHATPDDVVAADVADSALPPVVAAEMGETATGIAAPPVLDRDAAARANPPVVARRETPPAGEDPWRIWLGRFLYAIDCIASVWGIVFGAVSLMVLLAVLATVPVLNLLSLGYLLEASGRVAGTGKLRRGFIGLTKAYRVGSIIAGTWIMLLPLRILSGLWYESSLIDPGSVNTLVCRIVLIVSTLLIVAHILLAWYAGGKLRHFFWPVIFPLEMVYGMLVWAHRKEVVHNQWPPPILLAQGMWKGDMYTAARDEVWNFVAGLRLPHYFWLGLRGFAGALIWLFVPVMLLIIAANLSAGWSVLLGLIASWRLAHVVVYLPFLQTNFAVENRFAALFDWWGVRMQFRRAPVAFWLALLITLMFAMPLYLLKIEATPAEVAWLPALVFVLFIFPARLITGWAMGRARRWEQPRFILVRWLARFAALPIVFIYVLFVYLSQFHSWYGPYSFIDQHAFLLPVPFLGM